MVKGRSIGGWSSDNTGYVHGLSNITPVLNIHQSSSFSNPGFASALPIIHACL